VLGVVGLYGAIAYDLARTDTPASQVAPEDEPSDWSGFPGESASPDATPNPEASAAPDADRTEQELARRLCAELDAGMNRSDYTREELEQVAGVDCP
jgi:hypothetical protein